MLRVAFMLCCLLLFGVCVRFVVALLCCVAVVCCVGCVCVIGCCYLLCVHVLFADCFQVLFYALLLLYDFCVCFVLLLCCFLIVV